MFQARRGARLLHEALLEMLLLREMGMGHFQRDGARQVNVIGAVHSPHAALTDEGVDAILVDLSSNEIRHTAILCPDELRANVSTASWRDLQAAARRVLQFFLASAHQIDLPLIFHYAAAHKIVDAQRPAPDNAVAQGRLDASANDHRVGITGLFPTRISRY